MVTVAAVISFISVPGVVLQDANGGLEKHSTIRLVNEVTTTKATMLVKSCQPYVDCEGFQPSQCTADAAPSTTQHSYCDVSGLPCCYVPAPSFDVSVNLPAPLYWDGSITSNGNCHVKLEPTQDPSEYNLRNKCGI